MGGGEHRDLEAAALTCVARPTSFISHTDSLRSLSDTVLAREALHGVRVRVDIDSGVAS